MEIIPLKTPLIKPGEDLTALFFKIFKKHPLKNKDIVVISSKIVAVSQNRLAKLNQIKPQKSACALSRKYNLSPAFCELVIKESDMIVGGVKKAILTLKNGMAIANAGIDLSNVKPGFAVLWPQMADKYLDSLKKALERRFKAKIGLILADSHCSPLRLGTRGLAMAIAGFSGIIDERGKKDLFGKKMLITRVGLADELASIASALMGEREQKTPLVIIRQAPITLSKKSSGFLTKQLLIKPPACLFRNYQVK
jgi:coenzyme F420-0:L-glutamate ligase/coenzyme F420-1:gamma-L-glutamate ligase